ncbi:Mor transcription activator family protein [Paraclostridium sordellii]|uniref:Mor transcription activator family protein n=1 Tax=Paraclostridium sordellii TaxID=1505 RepID=UPI003A8B92A0
MPQNNQDLARLIGTEYFKKLVKYMGGSSIYIPKEKKLNAKTKKSKHKTKFQWRYRNLI